MYQPSTYTVHVLTRARISMTNEFTRSIGSGEYISLEGIYNGESEIEACGFVHNLAYICF